MNQEMNLRVTFARPLSEREQAAFWDALISTIEDLECMAGGGHSAEQLDWNIDYSESGKSWFEVRRHIRQFLEQRYDIVDDYYAV